MIGIKLSNDSLKPMYNRAISGTYAPGSTYKMLVGLVGLQTGKFTVDENILIQVYISMVIIQNAGSFLKMEQLMDGLMFLMP